MFQVQILGGEPGGWKVGLSCELHKLTQSRSTREPATGPNQKKGEYNMTDRATALIDMTEKFWSRGIWIAANGKTSKLTDIPDEYLINILRGMISHAVSSLHYDYCQ
jgi:hypothetical protein